MWSHFHDLKEREEQNGKIIPKWRREIIREKRICVCCTAGLIFLHAWLYLHRPGVRTLSADMIMKLIQMLQSAGAGHSSMSWLALPHQEHESASLPCHGGSGLHICLEMLWAVPN